MARRPKSEARRGPGTPAARDAAAPPGFQRLKGRGPTEHELEIGYVSGIFGVRGEVRLFLHHRESDLLDVGREVVVVAPDGTRYQATLKARSGAGNRVLGAFKGQTSREVAASLKDWRLYVPLDALPEVAADEFYLFQVEGAEVRIGDEPVGTVVAVHATPAADLLEIDLGHDVTFVPCLREFVVSVDGEAGLVVLHEGAIDDGEG